MPDRRPRNSIAKLMSYRPYRMHRRTWMRLILTARFGWRGDMLETETTAALMAYQHRKANRRKWRPEFQEHIVPLVRARRQEQARRALAAEGLPIGDSRWID